MSQYIDCVLHIIMNLISNQYQKAATLDPKVTAFW